MSFTRISKKNNTGPQLQGISIACHYTGARDRRYLVANLCFGEDLLKNLQWKKSQSIDLQLGNESTDDSGWLLCAPDPLNGFKLQITGKQSRSLKLVVPKLSGSKKEKATSAYYEIRSVKGALYIKLPDWAPKTLKGED